MTGYIPNQYVENFIKYHHFLKVMKKDENGQLIVDPDEILKYQGKQRFINIPQRDRIKWRNFCDIVTVLLAYWPIFESYNEGTSLLNK